MGDRVKPVTRVLRNGWVLGLLWCVALADFVCVYSRSEPVFGYRSVLTPIQLGKVFVSYSDESGVFIREDSGEFEYVDGADDNVVLRQHEAFMSGYDLVAFSMQRRTRSSGIWGRSRTNKLIRFETLVGLNSTLTNDEIDRLQDEFFARRPDAAALARARSGRDDVLEVLKDRGVCNNFTIHYAGYVHDVLALVWLIGIVTGTRARRRWLREQRRLARFLCPTCKYDLRGLGSGVCPECGNEAVVR